MTREQLERRLDTLEHMILTEQDWRRLPPLNACFQKLLERLVDLDNPS